MSLVVTESREQAHPLSRASAIAMALMRHFRVERFADLAGADLEQVRLTADQVRCLTRSRRWLAVLVRTPETTLAACTACDAVVVRTPAVSLPSRCSATPGCTGRVSWAGRARVVADE